MERNPGSSSGLEWENLAVYSGKPIEISQQIGFSMSSSASNTLCSEYPISASKESMDGFGKLGSLYPYKSDVMRTQQNISGTIFPSGASSASSGESMIGLRLGRAKEYGDNFPLSSAKTSISSLPISLTPTKRPRSSYQNMQNPCCQVEGCKFDLKTAKDYHRRHKICESHSKSPKVIVAGMERRFCQQCSRFHELSEFDDKKRSCRRRLSDHNARRRRVQPESFRLSSVGLPSALYDQRRQNVLLNGLPISLSNSTWENASTSMLRQAARDSLIRPSKAGGLEGSASCFTNDEIHSSISNLHMNSERLPSIQTSNQCLHMSTNYSPIAPDLLNAHSLLSSNSWSLNEGEPMGFVHENYNPVMRHSDSEPYQFSLLQTNDNFPGEQGPHILLGASHLQEYQLFKAPYDSSGGFYSSQRNL